MTDAERATEGRPALELRRFHPTHHREVVLRRAEVLTDGDDVHPDRSQVGKEAIDLADRLAETDHQSGLDGQPCGLRPSQHSKASCVAGGRAHGPLQTRNRLHVVVEHIRAHVEQSLLRCRIALCVADQRLDPGARAAFADRDHTRRHVGHAAVVEVVAGHHREHRMLQIHGSDRLGNAARFVGLGRLRLARVDEAEAASPGAAFSEHHERRGTVGPTIAEVRAAGLLAHRHQPVIAYGLLQRQHVRPQLHLRPQPLGLAGRDRQPGGDAGLDHPRDGPHGRARAFTT